MKKIFISVMALAMSVVAMASETAYVQIRLTGEVGGVSNSVYLTEDDAYTSAYESGADAEKIMSQSNANSVLMYGFVGSIPCGDVVTNNLDGLQLGLKTNMVDVNYTLTFVNVSGRTLTLLDRVTNEVTTISSSAPYAFSVTAAQVGQKAIDDRFVIGGTPEVSLCFKNNILEVNGYKGKALVIKQGATEIANVASLEAIYSIDLSAYNGRLVVTLDGKDYQIDANPEVIPANPE